MEDNQAALEDLQQREKDAYKARAQMSDQELERAEQATRTEKENQHLRDQSNELASGISRLTDELVTGRQKLAAEKAEFENCNRHCQWKTSELGKAIGCYSQRLGLTFSPSLDGIHMIFTNIDPKNADRQFSLELAANGSYHVIDCSPMIDGLEELVASLRASNDFKVFVVRVRQCFKSMV